MTKSTDFDYYEAGDVYGVSFFQLPKVLVYGEQHKHLNSDAKLTYMMLKDWLEYSLHNHWTDEGGRVYFIFTNQELENLFNYYNQKVVKLKRELEAAHLLMQKQVSFNPETRRDEPNRLYLPKLDVKAIDAYLRGEYAQKEPQTLATSRNVKITLPRGAAQTLTIGGNVKITLPHKSVDEIGQTLTTSGSMKVTHNLDKEQVLGTDRYSINIQKLNFSATNFSPTEIEQQNHDSVKHANDFLTGEDSGLPVFLEPEAVQSLSF